MLGVRSEHSGVSGAAEPTHPGGPAAGPFHELPAAPEPPYYMWGRAPLSHVGNFRGPGRFIRGPEGMAHEIWAPELHR